MGRTRRRGDGVETDFLRVPGDLGRMLVEIAGYRGTSVAREADGPLRRAVEAAGGSAAPPAEEARGKGREVVAQVKVAKDLADAVRALKAAGRIHKLCAFVGAALRADVEASHLAVVAEMAEAHGKRLAPARGRRRAGAETGRTAAGG